MLKLIEDFIRIYRHEIRILNAHEQREVESKLIDKFSFEKNTINWEKHPDYRKLINLNDLESKFQSASCYFICDSGDTPVIETSFGFMNEHFEKMNMFSFDSWIVEVNFSWLIENHHERGVIITWSNK